MRKIRCKTCRNFFEFTTINDTICPSCLNNAEKEFKFIREYVLSHPRITIAELVSDTGISLIRINKYIEDGRLEIAN